MRVPRLAAAVIGAAVALGLTGCFGNPIKNIVEEVVEDRTGIEVSTGENGRSAALPDDWPGLPVPEGRIVSAMTIEGTHSLTIEVSREDLIESTIAELLAGGFTEAAKADYGQMVTLVLSSPEWNVSLGWLREDGEDARVLTYTASPVS